MFSLWFCFLLLLCALAFSTTFFSSGLGSFTWLCYPNSSQIFHTWSSHYIFGLPLFQPLHAFHFVIFPSIGVFSPPLICPNHCILTDFITFYCIFTFEFSSILWFIRPLFIFIFLYFFVQNVSNCLHFKWFKFLFIRSCNTYVSATYVIIGFIADLYIFIFSVLLIP